MAFYTTTVRAICENLAGHGESVGYDGARAVIADAIPKLFDFDFPVHDEAYRNVLCTKILKHYYMREIGAETVAQWKFWLDTRLNEIMPYYNQMYKSTLLEFNPLYDVDVTTTRRGTTDGSTDVTDESTNKDTKTVEKTTTHTNKVNSTENSEASHENNSLNLFSDTPQGTTESMLLLSHLTDVRQVRDGGGDTVSETSESTQNGNSTENISDTVDRVATKTGKTVASTTEDYLETVQGKHGGISSSKLLQEYRKTFLNIDTMIIDELADLFFTLW